MKAAPLPRNHPARVTLRRLAATHGCILTFHLDGGVTLSDATSSRNFPTLAAAVAALTPGAQQ